MLKRLKNLNFSVAARLRIGDRPRFVSVLQRWPCDNPASEDRLGPVAEFVVMYRRKTVVCPLFPLAPSTKEREVEAQADRPRFQRAHRLRIHLELRAVAFALAVEKCSAIAALVAR